MNGELILQSIQNQLLSIGYASNLIRRDYEYADVSGVDYLTRQIPLAAFAQDPPSYRNACIGVTFSNGAVGAENVARHLALGAPLIFEIRPDAVDRWAITGRGVAEFRERIIPSELPNAFTSHRSDWRPRDIFDAKIGLLRTQPAQLDFVDLGLLPALEGMVQEKLDRLLLETLADVVETHNRASARPIDDRALYKLLFRFVAAKVLRDRGQPGDWQSDDPSKVLAAIHAYYGADSHTLYPVSINDRATLDVAWRAIASKFYFQNLSVDDLAFIYENTFVTRETRRAFGTHSTPPHVAEYVLQKLPLETIDQEKRRVLEPCSGHGIFLVSAMRRLRELLPVTVEHRERHEYLRERLVGIDLDSFAQEVCRLNLMLADYPNPNGWQLHQEDIYLSDRLRVELPRADVVLCNPPFGLFSPEERERYAGRLSRLQKPAQLLMQVLEHPPSLLGFVVPRVFTFGRAYRDAHRRLAASYGNVELVALPDKVFNHSDHETVLILASERRENKSQVQVTCRKMSEDFYPEFQRRLTEPVGVTDALPASLADQPGFSLWIRRPPVLWRHLSNYPTLDTVAKIHRGIQWQPGRRLEDLVSRESVPGWYHGYITARQNLTQFHIASVGSINPDPENMVGQPMNRDWSLPKVLANAKASSRGPWRISAVSDLTGALATQAFHTITPGSNVSPELLASVLNSPVANAWLFANEDKRDNRVVTVEAIPVPRLEVTDQEAIVERVQELGTIVAARGAVSAERANALVMDIDALLFRAYGLTDALEAELVTLFDGHQRPLPFLFAGYGESFQRGKARIAADQEQRARLQRYQMLVEREFLEGLTSEQSEEMERLGQEIDRYYDPFYKPIIATLEAKLQERRGGR